MENNRGTRTFLVVLSVILFLLVAGGTAFLLSRNNNNTPSSSVQGVQTQRTTDNSGSNTQNAANADINGPRDTIPLTNTIYLGKYNNEYVLFYTDENKQTTYIQSNNQSNAAKFIGDLIGYTSGQSNFNYNNLQDPIRLYTFNYKSKVNNIYSFLISGDKGYVYISNVYKSIVNGAESNYFINEIFRINTSDKSMDFLWSHNIGDKTYGDNWGAGRIISETENKYVVVQVGDCYQCDAIFSPGSIVINIDTKTVKYLGEVGNVSIDLDNKKVSYQKLTTSSNKTGMQPAGETYTEDLP